MRRVFQLVATVCFTAALLTPLGPSAEQQPAVQSTLLASLKFRNIGPANMSGRIVDLAVVEADPYTFYVASATGGLWKTTDNGVTLKPTFEHEAVHSIGCVSVHQGKPNYVWLGSGEATSRQSSSWGDGIYKSADAGRTWMNVGLRDSGHVGRIVLHPTDPDIVFVAAAGHLWGPNKERGLYKSVDGGKTWTVSLFVDENTGVIDAAMDPSDSNTLYAAAYQRQRRAYGFHGGGPGSGLYKSSDGGLTWRKLSKGLPEGELGRIGISIYRKDPRIVYASVEQGLRYNASTAYLQRKAGVYRSEDKGETWRFMSDWNPRPAYSSQIRVDPSDDKRIYMVSYSYSDDGGRTFVAPRQSLHGDDRVVWVNPRDSRHLIKGDDGGVGISYDRGVKWLYVTSLPLSQYYRIGVDMQKPFWICGGLQDNGSWCGPSATYFASGILNDDWIRVGGGDGFGNLIDPTDHNTVYSASQYLGITRVDMQSREARSIRPGAPRGHIQGRRNWKTWGQPGAPEPLLGNAMVPANWDAPFILSPHDPKTIYAGTSELWKSNDRGDTWRSLGNLTTRVDRSTLNIMGQTPGPTTLSLDDGIPYYPTLTAIAESPLKAGLLYVGTDDGNVQLTRDDGRTWVNLAAAIPGVPKSSWVSDIEAGRHREGTVYVAFDNHASDDYRNYLYRSTDQGLSWTSIVGDLPANRVIKAVQEDPKNPSLLYAGTEFGFFLSFDGGGHWVELKNNLPRLPINDFVIHPRDNALVLATHGRGVWILDSLSPLQELTPQVLSADAHLFTIAPAEMIRYSNPKAHAGDMIFRGENPATGALIDYYLRDVPAADVSLSIHDAVGARVAQITPTKSRGLNRVVWDLRHPSLVRPGASSTDTEEGRATRLPGAFVMPGAYTVRLSAHGRTYERNVEVREDPRIEIAPAERKAWTETLLKIGELYQSASALLAKTRPAADKAVGGPGEIRDLNETVNELTNRIATLYSAVSRSTGPPTPDQQAQMEYFAGLIPRLQEQVKQE